MWKISPEAIAYLVKQQVHELTVEQPVTVSGCCIPVSEPPRVRVGQESERVVQLENKQTCDGDRYVVLDVEGIRLNIPSYLADVELTIDLTRFWRRERLVIEGWNLV